MAELIVALYLSGQIAERELDEIRASDAELAARIANAIRALDAPLPL